MRELFIQANSIMFLFLWFLSVALLYWIIKTAVAAGVREANERMLDSVRQIEKSILSLKKESN